MCVACCGRECWAICVLVNRGASGTLSFVMDSHGMVTRAGEWLMQSDDCRSAQHREVTISCADPSHAGGQAQQHGTAIRIPNASILSDITKFSEGATGGDLFVRFDFWTRILTERTNQTLDPSSHAEKFPGP